MINYKTINIISAIILTFILTDLLFQFYNLPYKLIIPLLIVVYICFLIYGSVFISSNFYTKAYCRKDTNKKEVALSFDDGPVEATDKILDILKQYQVPAMFFCIGKEIEKNKNIIKRIDAEGHLIGNHSYSHHFWFDLFSSSRISKELSQTQDLIYSIIGKKAIMFRPPYGVTNPRIRRAVNTLKLSTIGWSLRTFDTSKKPDKNILDRIKRKLRNGDIILFHDTSINILNIIEPLIIYLTDNDYNIVRIDKLLNINPYEENL